MGARPASRRRRAAGAVYGAYYAYLGIVTPFLPVWLDRRGLDAVAIAQLGGLVMIANTLGQLTLPPLAGRLGLRRLAGIAAALATGATAALALVQGTTAIAVMAVVAGLLSGALLPLADAIALHQGEAEESGWGRIRAWGSLGFAAGSLAFGWWIDRAGAQSVVPGAALALLAVLAGVLACRPASEDAPAPNRLAQDGVALRAVLLRADLWLLILAVATVNASHAYYYTFANLHWLADYGLDATAAGLLWAVGVCAEIAVFTWGARLIRNDHDEARAVLLLLAGALGGVARWGLSAIDPPLPILLCLQLLHGLTFGATFLGGIAALRLIVPRPLLPPVLGLFAALVHGVVIGAVTFALGNRFGPQGPQGFALMAGVAALGAGLVGAYAALRQRRRASPAR